MDPVEISKTNAGKKLLEKIRRDLRSYQNKSEILVEKRELVTKTSLQLRPTTSYVPAEREKEHQSEYDQLLMGKITDPNVKKRAIEYAELIVQPTTFCDLTLNTNQLDNLKLQITCCLPEHAQVFTNWWISNSPIIGKGMMEKKRREFENKYQSELNIGMVKTVQGPTDTNTEYKIRSAEATFSFV